MRNVWDGGNLPDRATLVARADAARVDFLSFLRHSTLQDWLSVDLTMPQWKVLMALHAGEAVTVGDLAHALRVRLPTVSGILDRLEVQDLVTRQIDARDRRVVRIELTRAGAELAARLVRVGQQRFRDWLEPLDDEELELVARAFEVLAKTAERSNGGASVPVCRHEGDGTAPVNGMRSRRG